MERGGGGKGWYKERDGEAICFPIGLLPLATAFASGWTACAWRGGKHVRVCVPQLQGIVWKRGRMRERVHMRERQRDGQRQTTKGGEGPTHTYSVCLSLSLSLSLSFFLFLCLSLCLSVCLSLSLSLSFSLCPALHVDHDPEHDPRF